MESEFLNGDGHETDQFLVMEHHTNGESSRPALSSLSPGSQSSAAVKASPAGLEENGHSKNDAEEQDAYAVAVAAINAAAAAGIEDSAAQAHGRSPSSKRKRKRKGKKTNESGNVNGNRDVVAGSLSPPLLDLHLSSSPVVERETVSQKEQRRKDAAADEVKLEADILLSSSPIISKKIKKRKKKNRQTSQEEESAQALLALNKGLAKSADNEQAIAEEDDEDEADEVEDDVAHEPEMDTGDDPVPKTAPLANKSTRTANSTEAIPDGQESTTEDETQHTDEHHFLVPADEDVEMAEAAMAVTAATASAALNATAAMELNGHVLDPAGAPERTISEHLAAHLAKVDPPTMQSQSQQPSMTDDMLVEHRLAVQLQQNGYAAPAMDGNGFVAVNQMTSPEDDLLNQMGSRSQKKRKRQQQQHQHSHLQPDSTVHSEHGLMVDPQLMQLDETSGFTLDHTPQATDQPPKRLRTRHDSSAHLHNDAQTTDPTMHAQGHVPSATGLGNPLLPRSGSWKSSTYNSGDLAHGGTFSLEERHAVDLALHQYCLDNDMTMDQLRERVWGNNRRKDEFWDTICNAVPNRSRASVYKHVRRTCHIFQQRAKWNAEEDEELAMLVAEKGNKWKDIGLAMGRMGEDCRDRYRNYVKCGKDRGTDRWTKEEEDLLTATVTAHKDDAKRMLLLENKPLPAPEEEDFQLINWTIVSDLMKNRRSRIQCRYKWKKMITQREKQDKAPVGITYEGGKRKKVSYNIEQMLPGDKYWLLKQIQATMANKEGEIPWDDIAKNDKDIIGIWSQKDLKAAYRELRKDLPFRRRPLRAILDQLLQQYEALQEDQRTARFQPTEADRDAAAAASSMQPVSDHQSPTSDPPSSNPSDATSAPVANMTSAPTGTVPVASTSHNEDSNSGAPVLDPVLMAGGALDELEKSHSYSAGLEAAARVVRNAMQAQQAAATSSGGALNEAGQNSSTTSQTQSPTNSGVEGESQEEQELRRRLLGGFVTENVSV